jgi:hypothetical protein
MFELVELDRDGEEMELICEGSFQEMEEAVEDILQQTEEGGYDWPTLVIQPATPER